MRACGSARRPLFVSVVTETFPPEVNGVARTIGEMVAGLRERGHRVEVVRPRQRRDDTPASAPAYAEVLRPGLPIPRYGELRIGLPAKRALMARWRDLRPDVVQVVTEGPLGWTAIAAARQLDIPAVSEFHTNFHTYSRHYGFGTLAGAVASYLRSLHNRSDCTLVPTDQMRRTLEAAGYQRLRVVERGVDASLFSPSRRNSALRTHWGAPRDEPVALHVGRLAPEKGLDLFVEAALAAHAVEPRTRIVLVGDGPAARRLRARHGEFVFAGMRFGTDLAEHYASADIFLFPSTTETFGNVTTEALASGLAVAAFDYAAARRHIEHEVSGMLAPYGDRAAFVANARRLAADAGLRDRLKAGAARVGLSLSWDRVLDDLEAVFRELLERNARMAAAGSRALPGRTARSDRAAS
jgi:glycosyltransferase involved in cell wall biosynthesis